MIRVVPTGDLGLDVLLGGGWRLIKRFEDTESATVIVRGGSGAGKTLLGIQAAIELARALGGDVAVGCVEILPTEYAAQLQSARPSLAADRVARLPARAVSDEGPRVYVGLLQLEGDQPDLVTALEDLDARVREAGGNPTAFIVDSLIEGYGLGASRARIEVDDILKFAVRYGRGLVLCEETPTDAPPSPWVFAADTVLQLGVESRERGRWIEVKKHRFGPSATGRHELELVSDRGPTAFPQPHAWRACGSSLPWFHQASGYTPAPMLAWRASDAEGSAGPTAVRGKSVLALGDDEFAARAIAMVMRPTPGEWWGQFFVELDPTSAGHAARAGGSLVVDYLPVYRGPARTLTALVRRLTGTNATERECFVLGDLRHAFTTTEANEWVDALGALIVFAAKARPNCTLAFYCSGEVSSASEQLGMSTDVVVDTATDPRRLTATIKSRHSQDVSTGAWLLQSCREADAAYLAVRGGHRTTD